MTEKRKDSSDSNEQLPSVTRLTEEEKAIFSIPPPKITGYQIIRALGEGGMGVVYLADQQEPIGRRVALKVIKPGMDSKQVIARFETERQALALLEHPNIAQVFDAGLTEDGRPYFAMEYVEGPPITEYCDKQRLSIDDRLRLFIPLCDAVQHAHQKGIIHRDIKPSNILVLSQTGKAVPKIIDFGVAKATSQPLTHHTLFTEQGQFIGTPEYMSPEQAEMAAQDIDTRTDIYSLGVMLYELLTGVLPFERKAFQRMAVSQIQRIIREQDPPRPSTRLTNLGDQAKRLAEERATSVSALARRLHQELEWIPLKAMRKERAHRYRSASELADDIQNYLSGAPLIAGPESAAYRIKKFVGKHQRAVTAVVAVMASLLVGFVLTTIMYFRAEEQKQATRRANEKLRWENCVATLGIIQMRIGEGQFARAREMLYSLPLKHRGWEWGRLMRQASPELLVIRTSEFADRPVGSLHNAIFSPDGRYVLDDRPGLQRFSVIDLQTGKTVMVSRQYPGGGWRECMHFTPDQRHITYCSGPNTVDVLNPWDGDTIVQFDSGEDTLRSLVISSNGELAAGYAITEDTGQRRIIVWDATNGTKIRQFQMDNIDPSLILQWQAEHLRHESEETWWLARLLLPRGRVLGFLPDNQHLVYADEHLGILDVRTGNREQIAQCHSWLSSYASESTTAAILNPSNQIELWDVIRKQLLTRIEQFTPTSEPWLAIDEDARWVAALAEDGWDLWQCDSGRHIRHYVDSTVKSIAFSPSGSCAVTTSLGEIKVWSVMADRNAESKLFVDAANKAMNIEYVDLLNGVHAFDHSRRHLATGDSKGRLALWDVPSFRLLKQWQAHGAGLTRVQFSFNDELISTSSADGTAKIWETTSGKLLHTIDGVAGTISRGVSFSADGRRLAVGAQLKDQSQEQKVGGYSEVRLFDTETGELLFATARARFGTDVLAYSQDAKWLVVGRGRGGGVAGSVSILDAETGQELHGEIPDMGDTRCLVFSPDCRYMLALGMTLELVLWDMEQKREVWRLRNIEALDVAFHPDGQRFVTVTTDGRIAVHATLDGREVLTLDSGHGWPPIAFSFDGRQLFYRLNQKHIQVLHSDDWTLPDKKAALEAALRDVRQELHLKP
ncbi:MAG TPA: WD40 repeat domain-containing serine/threonine-protein kinase [Sedimentisphaerales bacterium]|nr:WD40 repeat domain-containing serine/threonine-protein kinase [Sedimentisphaerales bacterium]